MEGVVNPHVQEYRYLPAARAIGKYPAYYGTRRRIGVGLVVTVEHDTGLP